MLFPVINTRADLDHLIGTDDYALIMTHLRGSLFRLIKNDAAQAWEVVADDTTINRFGFVRADFSDVVAPDVPVYDVAAYQAEVAKKAQDDKEAVDHAAAKNYAKLTALKNMSPAEIQAWVMANVNTLAQAKDAIMTLAVGLSILARRL